MPRAFSPEESARIRRRLLDAGRALLQVTGFRRTSVDALVKRAGISKGSFYLFFPKKEALWVELLGEAERDLRAQLTALASDPALDPQACLRALLRALFTAVTEHPMLRALADPEDMAWLLRTLSPEAFEEAKRDDQRYFGELHQQLIARGVLSPGVSQPLFVTLPSAALAIAQGRSLIGEESFAAFIDFQIEAWLARLAPDPGG